MRGLSTMRTPALAFANPSRCICLFAAHVPNFLYQHFIILVIIHLGPKINKPLTITELTRSSCFQTSDTIIDQVFEKQVNVNSHMNSLKDKVSSPAVVLLCSMLTYL